MRRLVSLLVLGIACLSPAVSHADPAHDEAARIGAAGKTLKWNWTPPGRTQRFGHAEVVVHATLAAVRAKVTDFGSYKTFAPARFKSSRVVGHEGDGTDVYLEFSALKGMVTLWNVTRFKPARVVSPGTEVIEGKFVKGNVDDVQVVWTLRALQDDWTILECDLLLKPGLPAPQSALDEELRDGAQQAVDGVRVKAQGHGGPVQWPPAG